MDDTRLRSEVLILAGIALLLIIVVGALARVLLLMWRDDRGGAIVALLAILAVGMILVGVYQRVHP